MNDHFWWENVVEVNSRFVPRDTGAYLYLQRMIQQPEHCKSKPHAEEFLKNKLGDAPFIDYEVKDILELNIPYFYNIAKEKHLYDGNGDCYSNLFPNTAVDWIKKHLLQRSEENKLHNCEVIRTYLPKKIKKLKYVLV